MTAAIAASEGSRRVLEELHIDDSRDSGFRRLNSRGMKNRKLNTPAQENIIVRSKKDS
jgi:hypothetical protein